MELLKQMLVLIKFRIALLSTLSAVTGYIVAAGGLSPRLLLFTVSLFLLAAGSAGLNQYQERRLDGKMERTQDRPLPSGRLTPWVALAISLPMMGTGVTLLWIFFGKLPALLGLATAAAYNGVYTYLKRVTAFAAVPGAVVGALPPAIGWTAAGGDPASSTLMGLVAFFYIWQIPHFWLLLGIHSGDYHKAGFPSLTDIFNTRQLSRITFIWVLAAACAGLLFPLFGMFQHTVSLVLLTAAAGGLAVGALPLVKKSLTTAPPFRRVFMTINIFALVIMMILIIDHGVLT